MSSGDDRHSPSRITQVIFGLVLFSWIFPLCTPGAKAHHREICCSEDFSQCFLKLGLHIPRGPPGSSLPFLPYLVFPGMSSFGAKSVPFPATARFSEQQLFSSPGRHFFFVHPFHPGKNVAIVFSSCSPPCAPFSLVRFLPLLWARVRCKCDTCISPLFFLFLLYLAPHFPPPLVQIPPFLSSANEALSSGSPHGRFPPPPPSLMIFR